MHWAGFVVMGASTYLPRCTSAETTPAKATAAGASDGGAGADSAKDGKTGKEWLREKLQEAKELFEEELISADKYQQLKDDLLAQYKARS